MSMTKQLPSLIKPTLSIVALLVVGFAIYYIGTIAASIPSFPPPPTWLDHAAQYVIDEILPLVYWLLFGISILDWDILRWQRKNPESPAARWNRRFYLVKAIFLWLVLSVGRTLLQEWRIVGYATGVLVVALTGLILLGEFGYTYLWPVWKCRGGRCVKPDLPLLDAATLGPTRNDQSRLNST